MDLATFLDMGGYAAWVWPSYALAAVALLGMLITTLRTLKARQREFEEIKSGRSQGEA